MDQLFIGIDPGQTGGLGVIDANGQYYGAWRWDSKAPINIYNRLILCRDMVNIVYLELIQTFPQKSKGFITRNQATLVNYGIWQGNAIRRRGSVRDHITYYLASRDRPAVLAGKAET